MIRGLSKNIRAEIDTIIEKVYMEGRKSAIKADLMQVAEALLEDKS